MHAMSALSHDEHKMFNFNGINYMIIIWLIITVINLDDGGLYIEKLFASWKLLLKISQKNSSHYKNA